MLLISMNTFTDVLWVTWTLADWSGKPTALVIQREDALQVIFQITTFSLSS